MSTLNDAGLALLPEQQQRVLDAQDGASWGDIAHLLHIQIKGALDVSRLQAALNGLSQRHTALLARLATAPGYRGLRQFFEAGAANVALAVDESSDTAQVLVQWCQRPVSLASGVFFEGLLQRIDAQHWQLTLGLAGFVGDQASLGILYQDLCTAYEQGSCAVDEELGQFAQYLEWHAEVVLDEDADTAKAYWQACLPSTGVLAPELPVRYADTAPGKAGGQTLTAALDPRVLERLSQLAAQHNTPVTTLLQAAWWVLLARVSGREGFVAGLRHHARQDYEFFAPTVGLLERTLPLNLNLAPTASFTRVLAELTGVLETHGTWQEYAPLDAGLPLTHGFGVRQQPAARTVGACTWSGAYSADLQPLFELALNVDMEEGGAVSGLSLDYAAAVYSQAAMQTLLAQYQVLLGSLLEQPDAAIATLSLLGEAERQRLLAFNPAPQVLEERVLLPEHILNWAEITPDALALVAGQQSLTYAELDAGVRQLSSRLRQKGVAPGSIVALALPRGVAQVLTILATWRTGAAYLPLDPSWPVARQAQLVEQAGAQLLVTQGVALDGVGCAVLDLDQKVQHPLAQGPSATLQGQDAAYVLFTSGTTGVPKGVVVEHRQLLNYVAGVSSELELAACRHFAQGSTVAADLGNTSLFGALYNGATLHIADEATMQDPEAFAAFIDTQGIDCLKIVPSHLAALLEAPQPKVPATLILGGEAIGQGTVARIFNLRADCRLFNHYGPTETTVGVAVHTISPDDLQHLAIPLTRVLPNNQLFVLNEGLQLVACGELGELYIGGQQLCRGYLNDPAQTDAAFINSPFNPGERLYRSGDLARYLPQGGIALYGRRDHQVKVRGFRIELAEIEQQLLRVPGVSEAVVLLAHDEPVAFVLPSQDAPADWLQNLKQQMAERLPAVMVPHQYQVVQHMPRLGNGKVDRQALQNLELVEDDDTFIEPLDALETLLASRMAQLLGRERLSRDRDFFAAGGHSLLVIKLVAGIRKLLHCEVHPGIVFDHPSPGALAQALRAQEDSPGQLEKLAQARLRLDAMSPEEKAALLEKARQQAAVQS